MKIVKGNYVELINTKKGYKINNIIISDVDFEYEGQGFLVTQNSKIIDDIYNSGNFIIGYKTLKNAKKTIANKIFPFFI